MNKKEEIPIIATKTVHKVVIQVFKDKEFSKADGKFECFGLPVNPETYTRTFKVEYDTRKAHGNQGTDPRYKSAPPEELKLEFIFDGTGTILGYHDNLGTDKKAEENKSVEKQICKFLKTVYKVSGNTHKPNYIKLFWGALKFACVMTNVDINYTLFDDKGNPLRAKATATFKECLSPKKREKEANCQSPDVTHRTNIEAADRIDLLVDDIYESPKYILSVARANGLTSIRQLPIGSEFIFPPIQKAVS